MNDDANTSSTADDDPIPLQLIEIARWQLPELVPGAGKPKILPGLPSLQRGAVWKPNQIELLWDSVLRGFPIGSMVVCERLKHQGTRTGTVSRANDQQCEASLPWDENDYTHHLLDGQQRANAVALGYLDPFADSRSRRDPDTLLWLDLQPDQSGSSRIPSQSSRSFLLRVTTVAHPWGFKVSDAKEPVRLAHADAREAKRKFESLRQNQCDTRPRPRDGWPFETNVPIPMAWALEAARKAANENEEANKFKLLYQSLSDRCSTFSSEFPIHESETALPNERLRPWPIRATALLNSWLEIPNDLPNQAKYLAKALMRAASARTVAFSVPNDVLSEHSWAESTLDTNTASDDEQSISNVEHLFHRLNSGGTVLDGDELRYSMIKAYWPGIESTIQEIDPRPPETQVALLGARLALDSGDGKLPAAPTVEALRRLGNVDKITSLQEKVTQRVIERQKDRERIEKAFGLANISTPANSIIASSFRTLDKWFLYDSIEQPWGLPKVLRSRLAEKAPEVFLFLLMLARFHQENSSTSPDEETRKKLLGLATAIHWFGRDRQAAVMRLWKKNPKNWLDGSAFNGEDKPIKILQEVDKSDSQNSIAPFPTIYKPDELRELINEETFENKIENWRWWDTLIVAPAVKDKPNANRSERDEAINRRWAEYANLLNVLTQRNYHGSNALLLMYAQREQMAELFGSYDPSRIGYWDSYNVPWDFDHILPKKAFYNRKQRNTYVSVCKEWGETIANLHIWPFELNRSRHDDPADKSLPGTQDELCRMILWDKQDCRPSFSLTGYDVEDSNSDTTENLEKVTDFVLNARSRMLRIYSDWFKTLKIEDLL